VGPIYRGKWQEVLKKFTKCKKLFFDLKKLAFG
jgi:hypothetical protein